MIPSCCFSLRSTVRTSRLARATRSAGEAVLAAFPPAPNNVPIFIRVINTSHYGPAFANTRCCKMTSSKQINATSLCLVSSRDWHSPLSHKWCFSKGARGTWERGATQSVDDVPMNYDSTKVPPSARHLQLCDTSDCGRSSFSSNHFFNAFSGLGSAESLPNRPTVDSAQFLSNMEPHESFPAVCQVESLKQATFLKQDSW